MPDDPRQDRAIGALLGLAAGDAVGTTLEFRSRDSYEPLTGMVGGGPFYLEPGQWTDDTSMALCLADSLLACGGLDQWDLMERFLRWQREGENSCTGRCFDIGLTVRAALFEFVETGNAVAGSTDPDTAGNGSLMRLSPVAIRWHSDTDAAERAARDQSVTTHGASACVESCAFFARLLVEVISGRSRDDLLTPRQWPDDPDVSAIAGGAWRNKSREEIRSTGYVIHTLEAALWCVARSPDFRSAVLLAANLGDDADTVAAVTGQLAGALWGASGIPADWRDKLAWGDQIERRARDLYAAG